MPSINQPILTVVPQSVFIDADRTVSRDAQRFLNRLRQQVIGLTTRTAETVGASPWVYPAIASTYPQTVLVRGGTVSAIEYSGDGVTFDLTGMTAGAFYLPPEAQLRIAWTVLPNVVTWTTGAP